MSVKLNKTNRKTIVTLAITNKYEKRYDSMLNALIDCAQKFVEANSFNDYFKSLKMDVDKLAFVQATNSIKINNSISVDEICFLSNRWLSRLGLRSPVLAYNGSHYIDLSKTKEYKNIESLIQEIKNEQTKLTGVIASYTNVKKMIQDLPWTKEYLPNVNSAGTGLIAVETITDLNSKYGK